MFHLHIVHRLVAFAGLAWISWMGPAARADLYATYGTTILNFDTSTGTSSVFASGGDLLGGGQLAFTSDGSTLFVASRNNDSILRYDVQTGASTIFASGSGLVHPSGLALSKDDRTVFVATRDNSTIRRYDVATGIGTIFNTGGRGWVNSLILSPDGSRLYASLALADLVACYDVNTGMLIDRFGPIIADPMGMAFGPDGSLYVSEAFGGRILRYDVNTHTKTTFAEGGLLFGPGALAASPDGSNLYVDNFTFGMGSNILKYDLATGASTVFATGSVGGMAFAPIPEPASLALLGIGVAGSAIYGWRRCLNALPVV